MSEEYWQKKAAQLKKEVDQYRRSNADMAKVRAAGFEEGIRLIENGHTIENARMLGNLPSSLTVVDTEFLNKIEDVLWKAINYRGTGGEEAKAWADIDCLHTEIVKLTP